MSKVQIDKSKTGELDTLKELISSVVKETITQLGLGNANSNVVSDPNKKSAYAKTESLLYNYRGFQRIVQERMKEIEELRTYGVPQKAASFEFVPHTNTVQGIVLPEEAVEDAIRNVQASVQDTVQAIALIDKCMAALKGDPYYPILEMRYFEGRTQEDIALELKCSQKTISQNKSRLVRELAMRLFPNQVINEMLE